MFYSHTAINRDINQPTNQPTFSEDFMLHLSTLRTSVTRTSITAIVVLRIPWFLHENGGRMCTYIPVVTIRTTSLTFNNSTFCHTVYLCVLCGSENKQRLFPYTALTDWFV